MCCSTRNSQATINYFMFNDFVNILFPKTCIGCSRALFKQEIFLCLHCKSELPEAQYKANTENPASQLLAGRTYFNTCLPLYYYYRGGKVQKIVKEMKYGKKKKPVKRKIASKSKAFKPCASCKSKALCKSKGRCLKKK